MLIAIVFLSVALFVAIVTIIVLICIIKIMMDIAKQQQRNPFWPTTSDIDDD